MIDQVMLSGNLDCRKPNWQIVAGASIAQLVEQVIRNDQVISSSLIAGSIFFRLFVHCRFQG